jgi:hypothetical protein
MSKIPYVQARDSVCFAVDGEMVVISNVHINYNTILDVLASGDIERVRPLLADIRQNLADSSDGMLTYDGTSLIFDGRPIHNSLSTRIISMLRDGYDVTPMSNFLRNLLDNPSKTAIDELYLFLEACDLPITADGHFIAYKMVREDYTDKHTGTMDNSPGETVRMDRRDVDDKRHNTCSDGLHFASLYYVKSGGFGSAGRGDRLLAVKVNPANVVSIPSDYNNSKGRACEYLSLREMRWDDVLSVKDSGFKLFLDIVPAPEAPSVPAAAPASTPSGDKTQPRPGVRVWTDADIYDVLLLLDEPDATLASVSRSTGMSTRQVARIRDGQVKPSR